MNIGQITIALAFAAALAAAYSYFSVAKSTLRLKHEDASLTFRRKLATRSFFLLVLLGLVASTILMGSLLTHNYDYAYVGQFSSNEQPFIYLVSAFWAGQEGTFLFWAVITGLMGLFYLRAAREEPDAYAMSIVSAFSAFLYLLMLVKSPFESVAVPPANGTGMNPLLQDPWMAIHPPILFVGYAASIFPFALVVSGLIRRKYTAWLEHGFGWTLFATLTLGAGIIIGAFWAYEVLGWGGYWGWDPVENSSLVPWITLLALIHGLLIQRQKGALVRLNSFLAIVSFLLVFYATFLTRSGILADFSVHSFVDLGINNYLIGGMLLGSIVGFGFLAARFSDITPPKIDASGMNRELALLMSMFVLCLGAAFTFVGMSSPIFTGLVGKASQVDISFYNKVNLPVAIAMALLLGITPFLGWTEDRGILSMLRRYSMPVALTLLSIAISYVAGVTSAIDMLFIASAVFALASNIIIAFRQYRSGWKHLGGPIAHIGIALLLIGIIGSGKYGESTKVVLRPNEPQNVYGYNFTFTGVTEQQSLKPLINITVADGKGTFLATPKLYFSEYNQAMMREPDIKVLPLKDIYISPLEMRETAAAEEHNHTPGFELAKGESKEIGGYRVEFLRFETGAHGEPGEMAVGARLKVSANGKDEEIMPQIVVGEGGQQFVSANLPPIPGQENLKPSVTLAGMSVESKMIYLELHGLESHTDQEAHAAQGGHELLIEVSTKPLMMVVWTGVVLIIGGTAISFVRRLKPVPAV